MLGQSSAVHKSSPLCLSVHTAENESCAALQFAKSSTGAEKERDGYRSTLLPYLKISPRLVFNH